MNPPADPFVLSSLETETLLFREVSYPDGCKMPPHEHEIDCVVLMLHGTMTGTLGGEEYEAGDSGLLFMPAWRPHSTRTHGGVRTFDVVFSRRTQMKIASSCRVAAMPATWVR